MINELLPKVKKIIEMAEKCRVNYENSCSKSTNGIVNLSDIDDYSESDVEVKLKDYLYSLPYEDIEAIEALMYLGRDKDYDKNKTPEEVLKSEIAYMRSTAWGKGDKYLAINQITEKVPLDKYLKSGLEILNK